jgi:Ran GTPase-activating protein (RanGAP) involved in mRNA processing and transport
LGTVIEADEAAANAFFGRARLDELKHLAIVGYSMGYWGREGLGRLGLEALVASGLLQRLKHLRLELLPLGDKGIETLAPALETQMETLELSDVYCKGDGAAALIDSPCMSSLRRLDLSANRIDADHVARMANVDMPELESLDLSGPKINPYYWCVGVQPILDTGASAWANSSNAKRLKRLRLSNCHLADAALAAVFCSSQFRVLTELDLSHSSFTAAGISQAMPGSPLWRTLNRLGLNDSRLDDDAMEALAEVVHAPALRAVELRYNSIGPRGAAALANWPVLANVWQLDLHDNVLGDGGLVALAQSPNLSRLLELDFEQDCWNSRVFTFDDRAAVALADSTSLPRLDCMFSGCVDEYHGTAYSPGFTKDAIKRLRRSGWMRPALRAACSDFSGIGEYHESGEFDETAELDDHDFRGHPFELNEREAEQAEHRMQQLRSPRPSEAAIDELKPPKISPIPDIESGDADVIEGLEFRDPIAVVDHHLTLRLSLEDDRRPLPVQVGKLLADTLGSVFRACSLGNFEVGGSGSRQGEDGRFIETDVDFYLGIKGDPRPALQLIRETLWWVGAPAETDLEDFPLVLTEEPEITATRFLQLATPKVTRWSSGHRIDRVPLSDAQRRAVRTGLAKVFTVEADDGWERVNTCDGGDAAIYIKYLDDLEKFDTVNFLIDSLTPAISRLVHTLMCECGFMLFPMAIAASEAVAQTIDCDWPEVRVVTSDESLHELLLRGAYYWWRDRGE